MSRIRPRRFGKHVSAVLDFLRDHGADVTDVRKTKHVHILFVFQGVAREVWMAGTPRDEDDQINMTKQRLRREFGVGRAA